MIARVLDQSEWHRVSEMDIGPLIAQLRPEDVKVVVIEAEDRIVASWSLLRMVHLEGVWVHPDHRNGGVVRALMRAAMKEACAWSSGWVLTGAADDQIRAILERMNAKKIPMDTYVLKFKAN